MGRPFKSAGDRVTVGNRFGSLTVKEKIPNVISNGRTFKAWRCECDCGNVIDVRQNSLCLLTRFTHSCGCYQQLRAVQAKTKHGLAYTSESRSWSSLKSRCYNPKNKQFPDYGGRGITVCDRWKNSLADFVADMGRRPKGKSIDRINNDGNYEPGNCRWATSKQQNNNRRPRRKRCLKYT